MLNLAGGKKAKQRGNAKRGLFAAVAIITLTALFLMTGCVRDTDSIVRIEERMFATHFSHIYINAIDYLGRTIQLEGVFLKKWWGWPYYAPLRYFVMRFVPDHCCGGFIGFEVMWPEGSTEPYPEDGSWVEATGVLGADSALNLYLKLSSLTVLDRRGAELVTQ